MIAVEGKNWFTGPGKPPHYELHLDGMDEAQTRAVLAALRAQGEALAAQQAAEQMYLEETDLDQTVRVLRERLGAVLLGHHPDVIARALTETLCSVLRSLAEQDRDAQVRRAIRALVAP